MFLASLPPARLVTEGSDAEEFLRRRLAQAGQDVVEAREA
jgi:hypothetical protein